MTPAGSVLDGKSVLMVFAHCDDELVCGWPVLQNPAIRKRLLITSSDRNNAARKWCSSSQIRHPRPLQLARN